MIRIMRKKSSFLCLLLVICLGLSMTACSSGKDSGNNTSGNTSSNTTDNTASSNTTDDATADQPAESTDETAEAANTSGEWIADRTITMQAYVDDIGYAIPDDWESTPVYQAIKERTGIDLKVRYTPGEDDAAVMSTQLAAGNFPDVIVSYLNNSSRPEMRYLLSAARDGLFADVSEYMASSKVYSKYLEDGYLPVDTRDNIVFRKEFNGAAYLVHLSIERTDKSMIFDPESDLVGGMFIQKRIVDELGIDPMEINNTDKLYDLLVAIKNAGFTDNNGNPVYPLGPKFWGGSSDSLFFVMREFFWNASGGDFYNMTADGEILHEAETEYVYKKIDYMRKLIEEGLVNPEFFTMDSTRAEEVSKSNNSAIISDIHNYVPLIYETDEWVPLAPQVDYTGNDASISSGKGGYGCFAISAKAENPGEIFQFIDWMSTYEGRLLCEYGIEGLSYNFDENGYPRVTDEVLGWINNGDKDSLRNKIGAGFDSRGYDLFPFIGTDKDYMADFGESRPGASASEAFAVAARIAEDRAPYVKYRLAEGLSVQSYLSMDEMASVNEQMSLLDYKETLVQAIYANNYDDSKRIIESFVNQMNAAGLPEFKEYLKGIYQENPKSISFN